MNFITILYIFTTEPRLIFRKTYHQNYIPLSTKSLTITVTPCIFADGAMRRPMRGFLHQQQHQQRVTYPCRNCGKHYNYHSSLARHLKHECGVEPKFQCPLCPYRTKHRSSLNTHLNGKHLKRRSGDTGFEILADRKFPSGDCKFPGT